MKKYLWVFVVSMLMLPTDVSGREKLRYAIFSAPPFMIDGSGSDAEVSGIDVDIVRELAKRMHLEVEFVRCSWVRCLMLMQSGDADVLSSVWKLPEREVYLQFFDTPFLDTLPITFYFKKGAAKTVDRYEDLYSLDSIGVLRGAGYFRRFDHDTALKKVEVTSQDQLFPMLESGRIEAMAGYVPTENYRLVVEGYAGKIERSSYEYVDSQPVYMAVSKKSPLIARFEEFNRLNTVLAREGVLGRIREAYYRKYSPEY